SGQADSQRGNAELPRVRSRRPDVECWKRVIRENRRNARGTHLWIIIHSCGEPNVVATTGTRITYEHARALERRAPRDRATRGMAEREGFEPSRDATIAHRAMPWKPSRSARPSDARDGGEREIRAKSRCAIAHRAMPWKPSGSARPSDARAGGEREIRAKSRCAIAHRAMPWKPSRSARPSDARDGGERGIRAKSRCAIAHRAMPWKPSRSARPSDARAGGERGIRTLVSGGEKFGRCGGGGSDR